MDGINAWYNCTTIMNKITYRSVYLLNTPSAVPGKINMYVRVIIRIISYILFMQLIMYY